MSDLLYGFIIGVMLFPMLLGIPKLLEILKPLIRKMREP